MPEYRYPKAPKLPNLTNYGIGPSQYTGAYDDRCDWQPEETNSGQDSPYDKLYLGHDFGLVLANGVAIQFRYITGYTADFVMLDANPGGERVVVLGKEELNEFVSDEGHDFLFRPEVGVRTRVRLEELGKLIAALQKLHNRMLAARMKQEVTGEAGTGK